MFRQTLLAALIGGLLSPLVHAQESSLFRVSGFGTLGATHFSRDDIDFGGGPNVQKGAGRSAATSLAVDSKLGLQMRLTPTANLEATLQTMVRKTPRDDWNPSIDWANVKYTFNENAALRVGRIGHPFFLLSDYRQVNYANLTLRPPVEVYNLVPVNSSDVIEGLFKLPLAGGQLNLQTGIGQVRAEVIPSLPAQRNHDKVDIDRLAYLNATYENGPWTLRVGRTEGKLSYDALGARQQIFTPLGRFGATGAAIRDAWEIRDARSSFTGIGATYDEGRFIVTGEYVMLRSERAYNDSDAWSLLGGYRIGKFTPYVSYSAAKTRNRIEIGDVAPRLAPLVGSATAAALQAGIQSLANASARDQETASLGVRWDVYKNMAIKAQYDRVTPKAPGNQGFLINRGNDYPTRAAGNVFAVSLDFVF